MQEGGAVPILKVWYCMVKAAPLDTLQLFFTRFGEEPIGNGLRGGGRAGWSMELLGHDEHTATCTGRETLAGQVLHLVSPTQ